MRIPNEGAILLAMITVAAGGLLIIRMYPAVEGAIDAVVICGLVCYLIRSWYIVYRRYKIADKTTLRITALIGVCAAAAVLLNAGKVVLLTLLCVIIASGAANVLYAVHLKREGAV